MIMKYKVFVDGSAGTTGLRIFDRLAKRDDIELITIDESKRKDLGERVKAVNSSDISFLCLPDDAAREVAAAADKSVKILDTSTAHRTLDTWVYGLPELSKEQREKIQNATRVAVPGCHATGFIMIAHPLVKLGICANDYPFTIHSITGYSGGGKKMIAEYEDNELPLGYESPRQYGLAQHHKHIPEMTKISGLAVAPIFNPIVSNFYSGMVVTVPLHKRLLAKDITPEGVYEAFAKFYEGNKMITVHPYCESPCGGFIDSVEKSGADSIEIFVYGSNEKIMLASRYDNLGKGSSGAALQCMNLMLGADEATGLVI